MVTAIDEASGVVGLRHDHGDGVFGRAPSAKPEDVWVDRKEKLVAIVMTRRRIASF